MKPLVWAWARRKMMGNPVSVSDPRDVPSDHAGTETGTETDTCTPLE